MDRSLWFSFITKSSFLQSKNRLQLKHFAHLKKKQTSCCLLCNLNLPCHCEPNNHCLFFLHSLPRCSSKRTLQTYTQSTSSVTSRPTIHSPTAPLLELSVPRYWFGADPWWGAPLWKTARNWAVYVATLPSVLQRALWPACRWRWGAEVWAAHLRSWCRLAGCCSSDWETDTQVAAGCGKWCRCLRRWDWVSR